MGEIRIDMDGGRTQFAPGEEIRGVAAWQLEKSPSSVEVRLFWYTKGKGTQDVRIVDTISVGGAYAQGAEQFSFRAPNGPYSFSGKLVSLIWALECVALPTRDLCRVDLAISPTGKEIVLPAL